MAARRGDEVVVHERFEAPRPVGSGFLLQPTGLAVLGALGLEASVRIRGAVIRRLYGELNARGHAHSIECWREETLVGGLYGVTLGGAFFGESMFSRARDASKVALVHLVARLRRGGWRLLDAQFLTAHLSQFGAVEMPQAAYLDLLEAARPVRPDARSLFEPMNGVEAVDYALQPTTQAS